MTENLADLDWFERVPKVELHMHLEGAIPIEALWTLVQKYGGDLDVPSLEALKQRFVYCDFTHFLQTWVWKNRFIRDYKDFTFIAEEVARSLAKQSIRYAEVFYSPGDFGRAGLAVAPITQAVRAGLDRVPGVYVALVADFVRNYGPERAASTLEQVNEARSYGLIGVGIGGAELEFPPAPFAAVYRRARELGFHTSAHAGEGAGADSIWGAVRDLRVERIGHGTRAGEDPALLDYLAAQPIGIEMCPLSNVATGVVARIEDHPIRRFFERGLRVTVNTDDPGMFGNSLAQEYRLLVDKLGFSREEIQRLILNAVQASWLPEGEKQGLQDQFLRDPAWSTH